MSRKSHQDRGFTLIEVLVALVILSVSLGAIYSAFSGSLRGAGRAQESIGQTLEVRSVFDRLGRDIPLAPGLQVGSLSNGDQWEMNIQQVTPFPVSSERQQPVKAFEATLRLYHGEDLVATWRKLGLGDG